MSCSKTILYMLSSTVLILDNQELHPIQSISGANFSQSEYVAVSAISIYFSAVGEKRSISCFQHAFLYSQSNRFESIHQKL